MCSYRVHPPCTILYVWNVVLAESVVVDVHCLMYILCHETTDAWEFRVVSGNGTVSLHVRLYSIS